MRVVAVACAVLLLAACGDDSDPVAGDQASGSVGTSTPTSAMPSGSGPTTSAGPTPAGIALPVTDGVVRVDIDPDAPVAELVAGWNDAGFDLLREQPVDDNVVFSPASIGHALLMAAAAADDPTRAAIETAFGLPDSAHGAWNAIDRSIADVSPIRSPSRSPTGSGHVSESNPTKHGSISSPRTTAPTSCHSTLARTSMAAVKESTTG
jgi:hypothetical protein